jgi:hypothetical protein
MSESSFSEMLIDSNINKVWELLEDFKNLSKMHSWNTSEHEDWIKTKDGKYHNFIWIQSVHPFTFDRICSDYKIAIRDEISYHVIKISYIAWLFLKSPPENIVRKVKQNPKYKERIAIYDLSQALNDKFPCLKLNKTDSKVFREFEKFMKHKLGIEIEDIYHKTVLKIAPDLYKILR